MDSKCPHIAKLDYRTIFSFDSNLPEKYHLLMNDYFQHFVQLDFRDSDDGKSKRDLQPVHCVNCGAPWSGAEGSIEWGAKHGEVHCKDCQWPGRAIHIVQDPETGEKIATLRNFPLMVHPDYVTKVLDGGLPKL